MAGVGRAIVWLRFILVPAWIVGAVLAASKLPSIEQANAGAVGELLPSNSQAVAAEERANRLFDIPLLSRTMVVLDQPAGLMPAAASAAIHYLASFDKQPQVHYPVLGALPLANVTGLISSPHRLTTVLGFLFIAPALSETDRASVAEDVGQRMRDAAGTGTVDVTGPVPARSQEGTIVSNDLKWVELATVLLVVAVLALHFRAVGVPLMALGLVGVAYVIANHALGGLGKAVDIGIPAEVEPVIVALLFGIVTDYVVFFVSRFRRQLAAGLNPREAACRSTAELLPVVLTAGLMIAGTSATLYFAGLDFLKGFGPGMAVAVVVGVGAALTLVPAILAIAGRVLLWPNAPSDDSPPPDPGAQGRVVTFASRHPYVTALVGIVLLAAPASGLRLLELGDPVMKDLPKSASARQGYDAVSRAFSPGLTGPTMVLVEGEGVGGRTLALNRFESKLRTVAGVSLVLGPADRPFSDNGGIAVSQNGNAARYLLVLGADPESHAAIETLDRVKRLAPGFAQQAGLGGAQVSFAGDTAITSELVDQTKTSLIRVAPAAFAVVYLLLALLLRSWLAPIYLLVVGAAVPAAALGLTVYVFQGLLGYGELAFFVPIAVGVLLLALGSDYNVFLVGRIWSVSRRMPMREAVRTAGSRAAGAITTAGIILALSFAAVALIPIASFREIAFAMAAGLLLDTFVARTLLIPALISIFQRSERDRTDAEPSVPAPV